MNKVIHYCWFGGNKKSAIIKKCINSWKKYLPDFEIKEWNEMNFNVHCCRYVEEAYKSKKWAFVSDYARCFILYQYGGLYFDTDVEVLKPLDDVLNTPLVALEDSHAINTGLIMYCNPHSDFCKWMIDSYHADRFILENGEYNLYTVCERGTEYFRKHGFNDKDEKQIVAGFTIYPTEVFCPYRHGKEISITEKTLTFHHYTASWFSKEEKRKRFVQKILGRKLTKIVVIIKHLIKRK